MLGMGFFFEESNCEDRVVGRVRFYWTNLEISIFLMWKQKNQSTRNIAVKMVECAPNILKKVGHAFDNCPRDGP